MESRRKGTGYSPTRYFQGTGCPIINMIKDYIYTIKAPASMANLYQPLDLTVTEFSKSFLKRKFTELFSF